MRKEMFSHFIISLIIACHHHLQKTVVKDIDVQKEELLEPIPYNTCNFLHTLAA